MATHPSPKAVRACEYIQLALAGAVAITIAIFLFFWDELKEAFAGKEGQ